MSAAGAKSFLRLKTTNADKLLALTPLAFGGRRSSPRFCCFLDGLFGWLLSPHIVGTPRIWSWGSSAAGTPREVLHPFPPPVTRGILHIQPDALQLSQTSFIPNDIYYLFTSSLSLLHLLYHRLRSEASLNSPNYTSSCYPHLPTLLLHFIFPKLSYLRPTNLSLIGPLIPIRIVNDFCPGPLELVLFFIGAMDLPTPPSFSTP